MENDNVILTGRPEFDAACEAYRAMKKIAWEQLENGDKKAALETISDFRAGKFTADLKGV